MRQTWKNDINSVLLVHGRHHHLSIRDDQTLAVLLELFRASQAFRIVSKIIPSPKLIIRRLVDDDCLNPGSYCPSIRVSMGVEPQRYQSTKTKQRFSRSSRAPLASVVHGVQEKTCESTTCSFYLKRPRASRATTCSSLKTWR